MDTCNKVNHGVGENCNNTNTNTMEKQSLANEVATEETETLGSVTHNKELEGSTTGLQIRSSARVSKKMRLDSIATPVVPEKKEPVPEVEKPEPKQPEPKPEPKQPEPKQPEVVKPKRRPWELWSVEDKNIFFEALNEFGKDFDAIQNYFATKARRKGVPEDVIKNKDQVRHFYYRTWHKVSKHLKFTEEASKATQELYALINYGELRKRIGCVSEKICLKLNELVYRGSTQIRTRGKTLRIKTPLCKALRKLNHVEEAQEELKLPARVYIELRPKHMEAWCRVQAASQNPCVRTLLPLQRRLTSLLSFLQLRWRPSHLKHRDKLLNSLNSSDLEHNLDEYKKEKEKETLLRVAPRPNTEITLPSFNLTEYLTCSSLSLGAHEERLARGETMGPTKSTGKSSANKKGTKRQRNECASERKVQNVTVKLKATVSVESVPTNCAKLVNSCQVNNHACDSKDKIMLTLPDSARNDINDMAVNHILSLQQQTDSGGGPSVPNVAAKETQDPLKVKVEPVANIQLPQEKKQESPEEILARIRRGWTREDARAVTVGELYLMFGSKSKIELEYWWEEEAKPLPAKSEGEDTVPVNPIAIALQKLVSIVKLNYKKAKLTCPCGHVCGAPNKSSSSRNKVPPKPKPNTISTEASRNGPEGSGPERAHPAPKNRCLISKAMISTVQDGVFRRPFLVPNHYKPMNKQGSSADAFKAQLDKFRPRYCNRRGRSVRPKGVVVQRMLPLLPKAPNGHAMVTLKVIPQTSQLSGEFMPIGTPPSSVISFSPALGKKRPEVLPAPSGIILNSTPVAALPSTSQQAEPMNIGATSPEASMPLLQPVANEVNTTPSSPPPMSPAPSISHLLDLELTTAVGEDISLGGVTNGLLDVSLPSHTAAPNFVGLLPGDGSLQNPSTPPTSPSRILKEQDNQWLNSEVADFSLSSFLGHLESPLKPVAMAPAAPSGDDTRLSSDVEAQLQCLMSENSVDYMAKFADLAAQIASDGANKK